MMILFDLRLNSLFRFTDDMIFIDAFRAWFLGRTTVIFRKMWVSLAACLTICLFPVTVSAQDVPIPAERPDGAFSEGVHAKYVVKSTFLPELVLVDIHSHLYRGEQDYDALLSFMDRNNVAKMALSGLTGADADQQSLEAASREPKRFLAFLRGFELDREHVNRYVRNCLVRGKYHGIGELFINGHGRCIPGDAPPLMEVYRTAGEFQVPVLFHWTIGSLNPAEFGSKEGFQQLKRVLEDNCATTFILAHCGKGPSPLRKNFPAILDYLLNRYKNLFMDISGLHDDLFSDEGELSEFGKCLVCLIEKYSDRFMLGFDVGEPGNLLSHADQVVRIYRKFLSSFSRKTAEKLAGRNSLNLFRRCSTTRSTIKKWKPRYVQGDPVKVSEASGTLFP